MFVFHFIYYCIQVLDHYAFVLTHTNLYFSIKINLYLEIYPFIFLLGNGDADIFGALKYATKMQFRLGVSKIFILLPCSSCDSTNMTVSMTKYKFI